MQLEWSGPQSKVGLFIREPFIHNGWVYINAKKPKPSCQGPLHSTLKKKFPLKARVYQKIYYVPTQNLTMNAYTFKHHMKCFLGEECGTLDIIYVFITKVSKAHRNVHNNIQPCGVGSMTLEYVNYVLWTRNKEKIFL